LPKAQADRKLVVAFGSSLEFQREALMQTRQTSTP
jgi:hypothetical protein